MMAEAVSAVEMWLLVSMLLAWVFSRAAIRLRQAPPTLSDLLLAEQAPAIEAGRPEPSSSDADALWRAVRIYERV